MVPLEGMGLHPQEVRHDDKTQKLPERHLIRERSGAQLSEYPVQIVYVLYNFFYYRLCQFIITSFIYTGCTINAKEFDFESKSLPSFFTN